MSRPSFFDWFYGSSASTAQGEQLDSQLQAINAQRYANASPAVQQQVLADEASGSTASAWNNIFNQQDTSTGAGMGLGSQNNGFYALGGATGNGFGTSGKGTTLGQLLTADLKDVLVLAAIGGAIWAFLKFGGVGFLKTLTNKNKWYVAGITVAAILGLWFIYSRLKTTATDTASTATGIFGGLKALNPFA